MESRVMSYIEQMRKLIGNRALLLVGTSVIVVQDEMILLQKRADTGDWGYPGGYLEPGETPEEAAARELLEETGLSANNLQLYGVFAGENRHFTYPNGHEVYVVDVVYICSDFTPSGVSPDDEVLEVRWFPFSDLPEQISLPVKDIIEGFIAEQG
jgi:8-oxo-dGTP pyrophosphatase MutT (NUDIX family)